MDTVLQRLLLAYENAEITLLGILKKYALEGIDSDDDNTWSQRKYKDIRRLRIEIKAVVDSLEGLDNEARELIIQQYIKGGRTFVGDSFVATNVEAINALALDMEKRLQSARFQVLRQTDDAYRRIVNEAIEQSVLGVDARVIAARRSLARFASEGITGFTARDGKHYDIRSYVEMSTRTGINNAFREGRITGLQDTGKDLIIVSSAPHPSPLCAPYERKVLSISGNTTGYTSLSEAKSKGLYHPNCRHSFSLYTPGLTIEGETDADKGFDDYEETQDLRYAERKVREWKRRLEVADNDKDIDKAKAKIKQWRDEAKTIAADNNLRYKSNRISNVQAR